MNEAVAINRDIEKVKEDSHRSVRVPVIIDYSSKTNMNLSLKEKLACDVFVQTQSYSACSRAIKEKFGVSVTGPSIKKWMDTRTNVRGYIARRLQDVGYFNNWTKERWIRAVEAHAQGMESITFEDGQEFKFDKGAHFRLKLLGEALGYMSETNARPSTAIHINFTQADGRV